MITMAAVTSNAQQATNKHRDDFEKLQWLSGEWRRTNIRPGRSGNEIWERRSNNEWAGVGLTLSGKDTVILERLKIIVTDTGVYYVADIAENKTPVYFQMTAISENGFTCENPEHDFPTKIIYSRKGTELNAVIYGNGKSIEYNFQKKY